MDFEWDDAKAAENLRKHGVSFPQAAKVFDDPIALDWEDMTAQGEQRFNKVGSADGRLLHVTYTSRSDSIRIISARPATRREGRSYYEV
jgi:uncharacterized protein